jgi:NitT/TauT family transport system ATP-binding protein
MADPDEKLGNQEAFYLSIRCPIVSTDEIAGLIHTIARNRSGERVSLPALGQSVGYDEERLLALLDLLDRLDLAKLVTGKVELTPVGRRYARASGQSRRQIFADQLTEKIPLVNLVRGRVAENPEHEVHLVDITADLRNQYPSFDIDRGLRQLIDWARYAGLFSYNDDTCVITLPPPSTGRR